MNEDLDDAASYGAYRDNMLIAKGWRMLALLLEAHCVKAGNIELADNLRQIGELGAAEIELADIECGATVQ